MIAFKSGEKIISEIRRHWIVMLNNVLVSALLAFVPVIVYIILDELEIISLTGATTSLFIFLTSSWLLLLWTFFYVAWTNYYLDVLVLTNKRLIDIEQKGLFNRNMSELRWENVQDITVEVSGFLATLLDFGNVHVQTAATSKEFIMKTVPRPYKIKDEILKQYELNKKGKGGSKSKTL